MGPTPSAHEFSAVVGAGCTNINLHRGLRSVSMGSNKQGPSERSRKSLPLDSISGFIGAFPAISRLRAMNTKAFLKLLITITSGVFLVSTAIRLYILFHDVQERGWASSVNGALAITLGFVFGFIYLQTLLSVKSELELARKLFSSARRPTELDLNTNRALVALQFLGFSGLFIALLFTTDNAFLSSLFMCLIAAVDFWTRYSISRNIATVFSDESYNPSLDEQDYDLIQKRRAVLESFLFERPHLVKEAARLVGCGIALCAATYGYFTHAAPI